MLSRKAIFSALPAMPTTLCDGREIGVRRRPAHPWKTVLLEPVPQGGGEGGRDRSRSGGGEGGGTHCAAELGQLARDRTHCAGCLQATAWRQWNEAWCVVAWLGCQGAGEGMPAPVRCAPHPGDQYSVALLRVTDVGANPGGVPDHLQQANEARRRPDGSLVQHARTHADEAAAAHNGGGAMLRRFGQRQGAPC